MRPGLSAAAADVPGEIDYRLARQRVLTELRSGSVTAEQVCDAQGELRRNAVHCGAETEDPCPVCDEHRLRHVTYVFGPRLPAHGRCITSDGELARIRRRKGAFTGYVVEVCAGCGWNHLVRSYLLNPIA